MEMFIKPEIIESLLQQKAPSAQEVENILTKSLHLERLSSEDVASLLRVTHPDHITRIWDVAGQVKEQIYGKRVVIFAPLYISNLCKNNCAYCAFRADNRGVTRKALSQKEIAAETLALIKTGQKRILLVSGEAYPQDGLDYVLDSVKTVYSVSDGNNRIRRINVNIAPLDEKDFKRLLSADIGTYQLFQETYHPETYAKLHTKGPKSDYQFRLESMDRAFQAGFNDVGIGILFGLYDYRFEVMALMQHIEHMESTYGLGPHTISVPRLEPAEGSNISEKPPWPIDDDTFKTIIAILRLAVPYTGIILSTRETAQMRQDALNLGVSQISAGSKTNPGGYSDEAATEQFSLGDHRPLSEVIADICEKGHIPSFCTGCYRLGRTGIDFMDQAKPGDIKAKCLPNALFTFEEYLQDYGTLETQSLGRILIDKSLEDIPGDQKDKTLKALNKIRSGKRDIFV
jgi:2-iminoacetate synthase